jgi:hypothetical protein
MEFFSEANNLIGFIIGLAAIASGVGKFLIFNPLRREIKDATRQIQIDSNGGLSLPDVAKKLDVVEKRQRDTESKIDLIVELLRKK